MKKALGLIETRGLVAAIAAADKALKSADIYLIGKEITEPGYVTIKFTGELNEVQIAVSAGTEAARDTGELISSLVILQPDIQLSVLLPDLVLKPEISVSSQIVVNPSLNLEKTKIKLQPEVNSAPDPITAIQKVTPDTEVTKKEIKKTAEARTTGIIKKKAVINKKAIKQDISVDEETPFSSNSLFDSANDTISRLRREALGKGENIKNSEVDEEKLEPPADNDISKLNVHQLRKLARGIPDFPLYGREISKANRDELIKLFQGRN